MPTLLQSLEARNLFCEGRALLFDRNAEFSKALDLLDRATGQRGDYRSPGMLWVWLIWRITLMTMRRLVLAERSIWLRTGLIRGTISR